MKKKKEIIKSDINGYDEWKLWNPWDDEEIYCLCDICGREIYVGEEYYKVDECNVHENCVWIFTDEDGYEYDEITRRVAGEGD